MTEPRYSLIQAAGEVAARVRAGSGIWEAIEEVAAAAQPPYSHEQALDFDYGLVDFDQWYEQMAAEVVWRESDTSHQGKSPEPRFGSVEEILQLFNTDPDPETAAHELGFDIDIDRMVDVALEGVEPLF